MYILDEGNNSSESGDFLNEEIFIRKMLNNTKGYKAVFDDLVFSDDLYYNPNNQDAHTDQPFPIILLLLTITSNIFLIISVFYLILFKKYKKSSTYHLLLHYLIFKIFYSWTALMGILTSSSIYDNNLYIIPTKTTCFMVYFGTFFIEASENFQLLLIWVILLSQRNLIGLKCLYIDFEQPEGTQTNASNQEPRTPEPNMTIRNYLMRHSRTITLSIFYIFVFLLSFVFNYQISVLRIGKDYMCAFLSNYKQVSFIYFISISFYFLPILFWLIILSTVFSKLFGGERDPILSKLDNSEINHLKFIKFASLLKSIEEFLLHIHSTSHISISYNFYEIVRIFGLLIVLLTSILFLIYEGVFINMRRRCLPIVRNNSRPSNVIFRNRGNLDQQEIVDYGNLVENTYE